MKLYKQLQEPKKILEKSRAFILMMLFMLLFTILAVLYLLAVVEALERLM